MSERLTRAELVKRLRLRATLYSEIDRVMSHAAADMLEADEKALEPETESDPQVDTSYTAQIATLRAALADIIPRFERCMRHAGSDDEFIADATEKHRSALSTARERKGE